MSLSVRILDADPIRLMDAEATVRRVAKRCRITAAVVLICEPPELCRSGVMDSLPALEIKGQIMIKGEPLEEGEVERLIKAFTVSVASQTER